MIGSIISVSAVIYHSLWIVGELALSTRVYDSLINKPHHAKQRFGSKTVGGGVECWLVRICDRASKHFSWLQTVVIKDARARAG